MINNLKNYKLGDIFDLCDGFESKYKVIHEDGDYIVIKEHNGRNTNYFNFYNKKLDMLLVVNRCEGTDRYVLFEQRRYNNGEDIEEVYRGFFYSIEEDPVKIYEDAVYCGCLPE